MAHKGIIKFQARVQFAASPAVWLLRPDGTLKMRRVMGAKRLLDAWKTRHAFLAKWRDVAANFPQYKNHELFLSDKFEMVFRISKGIPVASVAGGTALEAMLATIHIDHARDAKFGICARSDCHSAFEMTSAHARRYCQQYCAHLEAAAQWQALLGKLLINPLSAFWTTSATAR